MSQSVDSPVIVLFEDRPKQGMVFNLNLSIYLDARVTKATSLKDLKKAVTDPDGVHLVITRAKFKGTALSGKILELLATMKATVPVICLGDEKERPGLTLVNSDVEVKPVLQAAAKILGITARQMVSKQRANTYDIAPEFLTMLFSFPCDVFANGGGKPEKLFSFGETVPRVKINKLVKEGRPLLIDSFERLKLANAVTEQSQQVAEELVALPGPSDEKKMSLLSASLDMVAAQFQNSGMDEETVKLANSSIKAVEKLAESATSVGSLVKQLLDTQGGYRYAHCQLITFLGFHVIKMMGWWGDDQRSTLSQAAFYHDISLSNDEHAMVRSAKSAAELAAKDPAVAELLLTHAQLAARELQTAPEITPEVVQVVIQHHGSPVGKGFSTDIGKLDVLAKTFILAEEWCDYLMDLAQSDKLSDNEAKIKELKAIYKDEQAQQIIETFRYLDPEAFNQDFLSANEVDFAKSLIAGGGAGSEAESVVVPISAGAEGETRVKPLREAKLADLAKIAGEAGDRARTMLGAIAAKKPNATPEEVETLLKAGGLALTEETRLKASEAIAEEERRISGGAAGDEASTRINGATDHIGEGSTLVKGGKAEEEAKTKVSGTTDVRNDEKIVIKGDKAQDLVDRSITRIKADPQEKARELKMKALEGSTDLMKAAVAGELEKVKELLGSDTQLKLKKTDAEGRTAIHYAAMGGSLPVLQALYEAGASANSADSKRRSALFFAALYKHNEAFDFLLGKGGKIAQQAMGGMTIAMVGASTGNLHVLKTALQKGVKADVKDHAGKTAMDYAKQANFVEGIACIEAQSKPAGAEKIGA